jgi:hypothetical protein
MFSIWGSQCFIMMLEGGQQAMELTSREFWLIVHLGLGVVFLHTFVEGMLWLRRGARLRRLSVVTWGMATMAWLTVLSGTWMVYPWYRAEPPAGANVADFPRAYLLANDSVAAWHTFGMEWKEHVSWLSPFLATAVAWIVWRYGSQLVEEPKLRRILMGMLTLGFVTGLISGGLGALINKVAPNTFLDL